MLAATRRVPARDAGVSSEGPPPAVDPAAKDSSAAYLAQRVKQAETMDGGTLGPVTNFPPGYGPTYDPTPPFADNNGIAAAPSLDLSGGTLQHATARYGLAAVAQTMRSTTTRLLASLLDIKA
jgi:flagellar basal-body rod protein FlgC